MNSFIIITEIMLRTVVLMVQHLRLFKKTRKRLKRYASNIQKKM